MIRRLSYPFPISYISMNIQYVSDIHLEFHDKKNRGQIQADMFVKPSGAPYLALCGDIGIPELPAYKTFLEWCSPRWKKVFLVAGNHEYYHYRLNEQFTMDQKKEHIRTICADLPNVHFLDRSVHKLEEEGIDVLGCTLWSHIPEEKKQTALMYMNDFRQMEITVERFNELHQADRAWLLTQLKRCETEGKKALVLTHYLPSFQLIAEKYKGHSLNCCFASDSEDLVQWPACGWICGHSHTGVRKVINGVPCALNPHGYPAESVATRERDAILILEP
jgi:predicted phosphodiesterase